jgi:hypothetical protein
MQRTLIKPTREESLKKDKARAEALLTAYAALEKDKNDIENEAVSKLKPIKDAYDKRLAPIKESMTAAEMELSEIGLRNKKQFKKNRWEFNIGYLLLSKKTIVKTLEGFSWKKFVGKFPELVTMDFNIKQMKETFSDGDARPQVMKYNVDLEQKESIKVKISGLDSKGEDE